jgi:sec-independent protein translocase protein TatB
VFDISFSELMIIAVVTLLVVGPDKLPHLARTVGAFVGRLQRYVAQVKEEVNREVRFEELQSLQEEIKEGKRKVEASIMDSVDDIHTTMSSVKTSLNAKPDVAEISAKLNSGSGKVQDKVVPQKKSAKATAVKKPVARKMAAKKKTSAT